MDRREFTKTAVAATTAFAVGTLATGQSIAGAVGGTEPQKTQSDPTRVNPMKTKDEFEPGDAVPASGIYEANHDRLDGDDHALPHRVTAIAGNRFPLCRGCGTGVRFRLHQAAEHVKAHALFKRG
jgi:hypothetical protein